jgi:hypothetical protein
MNEVFKGSGRPQRHMGSTKVASLFNEQDIFLLLEVCSSFSLGLFEVWKRNGRQASKIKGACLLFPFFELFFFFLFHFIYFLIHNR